MNPYAQGVLEAPSFESRFAEGLALDVEAHWGAALLPGRYLAPEPSWSYAQLCRPLLREATAVLDMGTGDGAVLAGLAPLPAVTVAYEEWAPTLPAAAAALRPLGVHLVHAQGSADNTGPTEPRPRLPFASASFDLALNRHEAFDPVDLARITQPGGIFLTMQVGSDEQRSVGRLLGLPDRGGGWTAAAAVAQLHDAGWRIDLVQEEHPPTRFLDVAALIGYVRTLPWAYADLDWNEAEPRLRQLHEQAADGPLEAQAHRFVIQAHR